MASLQSLALYGHSFQIKVISALLTKKELLVNIHDIISEDYFDNNALKWIVKEIIKYYEKYHSTPTLEILKVELQKIDNEVLQISIKEQLKQAYVSSDDDLEYVQEEFTNFCRNQQLKSALMNSVDLLQASDFDGIRNLIDNALKAGQDKNIGQEYSKDIEERYKEDNRKTIPTPWPRINELLQGGLGNGDFGILFGNPGGGKSWGLVALGGFAAKLGYNVLHYTLELGENYVGKRYDSFFTKIPVNKIHREKETVISTLDELKGDIVIKEYPTGRATLLTVESHINKCESMGIKPDLIIIDYVDLLASSKNNSDRKAEIDDIYIGTKGLARHLDIPIWSASQVNRAGAQDKVIEGDKSAGSYDKLMITDFCMSLSRTKKDKVNNTGRFHLMKNRYGLDGVTFSISADTSIGEFKIIKEYFEDDEEQTLGPPVKSNKFDTDVDKYDKKYLKNKFLELQNNDI